MAKKSTQTKPKEKQPTRVTNGPRKLKQRSYKWYQPHKPIKHPVRLPSVWKLTKEAYQVVKTHYLLFLGITVVYGLLTIILVQGLSGGTDVSSLKSNFDQIFRGQFGGVVSGIGVFLTLLGSSGNSSSSGGPYQLILGLIVSLALIWALRQLLAGNNIRIRDTFYQGMYPLVPFLLVLIVICIQLLPFAIGAKIYSTVLSGGIAVSGLEKAFWLFLFIVLALWSLYLLACSVIALYIATLPDMTPLKALRSAKQLVKYRRWTVLRKMLALPIILLIISGVIMLPVILVLTSLAQWIFFALSMLALTAIHAYLYILYRNLLNE